MKKPRSESRSEKGLLVKCQRPELSAVDFPSSAHFAIQVLRDAHIPANYRFVLLVLRYNVTTLWIIVTLEDMEVIYLLEPYSNNELKRLVRTPKLYFCDTVFAHI